MRSFDQAELLDLRDRHEVWLRSQPGVVGTGVGMDRTGAICLKVFTNRMTHTTRDAIQDRLTGWPVALEEVGEVLKQS